ncbi:MAG: MEMO1 family protein [Euryarchaeota archaeon]|nr:MEMO1 family protein [Euryarchaeota archaeon]
MSALGRGVVVTIRNAAVAGQFYPGNEKSLKQQIEECFLDKRGIGSIPSLKKVGHNLKGLVVPHAGFVYSGAIASHAYGRLAEQGFADTFIILGPNHTGMGSGVSVMTEGAWKTPLGMVPLDSSLAQTISTGIIDRDASAHTYEHSIEVQLPFLQYIAHGRQFEFVPVCMMMQDYETVQEVGAILAKASQKSKKNIVLIASSDFSHAGFNYQSTPPKGMRVDTYAEKQDTLAIQSILALDPKGLIQTVEEHTITMCGYGPVAAMLFAAKKLGATKAELLKYGTSYEVHPGSSCVGYGAIAVA